MALVNEDSKTSLDFTAEKKAMKDIGCSPSANIMSYFQRKTLLEASKQIPADDNNVILDTNASGLRVTSVEQHMINNRRSDCEREKVSCFQQVNGFDDDFSHNDFCKETKDQYCIIDNHKNDESDSGGGGSGGCHGDNNGKNDELKAFFYHGDNGGDHEHKHVDVIGCHGNVTTNISVSGGGSGDTINFDSKHGKARKSQIASRTKWSLTWKASTKKSKRTNTIHSDSDSDFEENDKPVFANNDKQCQANPCQRTAWEENCINHSMVHKKPRKKNLHVNTSSQSHLKSNNSQAPLATADAMLLPPAIDQAKSNFADKEVRVLQVDCGESLGRGMEISNTPMDNCVEGTCSLQEDSRKKPGNGGKSVFDVLMQSSRDQASLKQTSPEVACAGTSEKPENHSGSPNKQDKNNTSEVDTLGIRRNRRGKKSSRRKKSENVDLISDNDEKDESDDKNPLRQRKLAKTIRCRDLGRSFTNRSGSLSQQGKETAEEVSQFKRKSEQTEPAVDTISDFEAIVKVVCRVNLCKNSSKGTGKLNENRVECLSSESQEVISNDSLRTLPAGDIMLQPKTLEVVNLVSAEQESCVLGVDCEVCPDCKQHASNTSDEKCHGDKLCSSIVVETVVADGVVEDTRRGIKVDVKNGVGNSKKSAKSFFDLLMQSSRNQATLKQTLPGFASEEIGEKPDNQLRSLNKNQDEINPEILDTAGVLRKRKKLKKFLADTTVTSDKDDELEVQNGNGVTTRSRTRFTKVTRFGKVEESTGKKCGSSSQEDEQEAGDENQAGEEIGNGKTDVDDVKAEKESSRKSSRLNKHQQQLKGQIKSENEAITIEECPKPSKKERELPVADETKTEVTETAEPPKKATEPLASIFLPGAWRRAKQKIEQAELLESKVTADDIDEDDPTDTTIHDSVVIVQEKDNVFVSKSSRSPLKGTRQEVQAFLGMFRKSPVKSSTAVVKLIEAPFPKVSHVMQLDDETREKWNLPMVRNRFVKAEFFFWGDVRVSANTKLLRFGELLPNNVQNDKGICLKGLVCEKVPGVNDVLKRAIVRYLKSEYYPDIPVRKLFRRCNQQLERCKKEELESENSGRPFRKLIERQCFPKNDSKKPSGMTSSHVNETADTFTKISEKKAVSDAKKKKSLEVRDSPLLMAFKKQGQQNASSSKDEQVVDSGRKTKQPRKKSTLRDFLSIPPKQVDAIPETLSTEQKSQKSCRAKRKCRKIKSEVDKENTKENEWKQNECKKRERKDEDVEIIEEGMIPAKKKAKLIGKDLDLKHSKKGRKRKQNRENPSDNAEKSSSATEPVVKIDAIRKTAKSPKISSDEDFVKSSKSNGSSAQRMAKRTRRSSRGTHGEKNGETGTRKSKRLQRKLDDERANKPKECDRCDEVYVKDNSNKVKDEVQEGTSELGDQDSDRFDKEGLKTDTGVVAASVESLAVPLTKKNRSDGPSSIAPVKDTPSPLSAVLWTECFKPGRAEEVLGNISGGNKLRNWLSEWKSLREKKLKEMKRHQEKKQKRLAARQDSGKKTGAEWWYDDDDDGSDFDMTDSSDGSFCEEDVLCNTMLLTGPTGCGKTSAVYACAEELGFKVIEVNSSSKRGGKFILSELQEATQSHQVSGNRTSLETGQMLPLVPMSGPASTASNDNNALKEGQRCRKKGSKKDREKGRNVGKHESTKNKQQRNSEVKEVPQGQMSLILLDEVDVLFPEDKGFWVAVNSLRINSKRPIVMTASDPAVSIDGIYEHITLKSTAPRLHAAHLQSVCLSKNVLVTPLDLRTLATFYLGDIRHSLLNLQFWVESNAGRCDSHGTSLITEITMDNGTYETSSKQTMTVSNVKEYAETPFGERENEVKTGRTEGSVAAGEVTSRTSAEKGTDIHLSDNDRLSSSQSTNCVIHRLCLESLLGLRNISSTTDDILKVLTAGAEPQKAFVYKCSVTSHCQTLGLDIVRCNLENFLPCVFACVHGMDDQIKPSNDTSEVIVPEDDCNRKVDIPSTEKEQIPTRNQIKDWDEKCDFADQNTFDDESSNDKVVVSDDKVVVSDDKGVVSDDNAADQDRQSAVGCLRDMEADDQSSIAINTDISNDEADDDEPMSLESDIVENTTQSCTHQIPTCGDVDWEARDEGSLGRNGIAKKLVAISLETFAHFVEDMSFMDSSLYHHVEADQRRRKNQFGNWYARVLPGLEDEVDCNAVRFNWKSRVILNEIRGALEVASLEHSHKHFHDSIEKVGDDFKMKSIDLVSKSCGYDLLLHSRAMDSNDKRDIVKNSEGMKSTGNGETVDSHSLPVLSDSGTSLAFSPSSSLQLSSSTEASIRKTKEKREQGYDSVARYLLDSYRLIRPTIALDYLPTLRNICRREFLRKASRTKRRFYHYFDSVGMNWPQSTMQLLTDDTFSNCFENIR